MKPTNFSIVEPRLTLAYWQDLFSNSLPGDGPSLSQSTHIRKALISGLNLAIDSIPKSSRHGVTDNYAAIKLRDGAPSRERAIAMVCESMASLVSALQSAFRVQAEPQDAPLSIERLVIKSHELSETYWVNFLMNKLPDTNQRLRYGVALEVYLKSLMHWLRVPGDPIAGLNLNAGTLTGDRDESSESLEIRADALRALIRQKVSSLLRHAGDQTAVIWQRG